MNKKLKTKWLRALRGGSYRQAQNTLVNDQGTRFCCLGVLADIQGCEWLPDTDNGGMIPISANGRKSWVCESNDFLPSTRAGGLSSEAQEELATMNDDGKSFKDIADFIETHL